MSDSIAAVATPFGPGAIAVLRLSGPEARTIAAKAVDCPADRLPPERTARRSFVRDSAGATIDEVVVTSYHAPRSYTGEDLVEISCHGGVVVTQRILARLLECGARPARPGEFTQRAFLHGKMDLTQAEAVMDIITAQTELALRAAEHQLKGRLGEEAEELRAGLLEMVAHVEAYIDFPDEDIDPATGAGLTGRLETLEGHISRLLGTAEQGRILREGVRTVISGAPNVGKSSLLNLLLGYERAIVSEQAGTTRDTVEEVVNLEGIPIRLIDTAGIRDPGDEIERQGVERARRHLEEADLVLEVVDASTPTGARLSRHARKNCHVLLVLNKCDLGFHNDWQGEDGVRMSCTERTGLEDLSGAIRDELAFGETQWGQEAVAVNARHQDCLKRARAALESGRRQLEAGTSPEFAALDLRTALDAVGEIAGLIESEEILGAIFGRFCIGK